MEDTMEDIADIADLEKSAKEGNSNAQYELGCEILKKFSSAEGDKTNDEVGSGIEWLIKSSKQGHAEATNELAKCVDSKIGVNDSNISTIQWCINTPSLEKKARYAAQNLFRTLNPLHLTRVPRESFDRAIQSLGGSLQEKKLLTQAGKVRGHDDLSEEEFVNKLVKRIYGKSESTIASYFTGSHVDEAAYENMSLLQKLSRHPIRTVMAVADNTAELAAKHGTTWLRSCIPSQQIYMLMLFFMYSIISVNFLFRVIPVFFFYLSFVGMLICTLQMFYAQRKMKDVRALASMLQKFNETLDTESAESSYSWQSMTPYISYFAALPMCVISFSMADKAWIPCSELVFLAGFMAVVCFFALNDSHDHLLLLSLGCSLVASAPVIISTLPKIPILHTIISILFSPFFSVPVTSQVQINFGIPSIIYMIIPLLFIRIAMKNSWQGSYQILIPHLVCFFWFEVCILFLSSSSWWGLVRGSVGWVMFIIMLPIIGIGIIIWLLAGIAQILSFSGFLKIVTTLALLSIPAGITWWAKGGVKIKGIDLEGKIGKILLIIVSIASVIPLVYVIVPPEYSVGGNYISWQNYSQFCSHEKWEEATMAHSEIACRHFKHMMVQWEGELTRLTIKKIENQAEKFVEVLPMRIGNWLRCTYGKHYPDCDTLPAGPDRDHCVIATMQNRTCHLNDMNRYTFELRVDMHSPGSRVHEVRIEALHFFETALLQLRTGDTIKFRAALMHDLGGYWPHLRLYYVECKSCERTVVSSSDLHYQGLTFVTKLFKNAIFTFFNMFTAPVMQFNVEREMIS